jgi:hypothetical protein
MAQRLDLLSSSVLSGESQRGVAGNQADKPENDQAGENEYGHGLDEPCPDVRQHRAN